MSSFSFFKRKPDPKTGDIYELDIKNPFEGYAVKVVAVRDGYVQYVFEDGNIGWINPDRPRSASFSEFKFLYRKVEA